MYHYLQVVSYDGGDPSLRLMCTAPPDAPCRRRPVDPDLETWTDTTPGHECWAVEWIEEDGWESVATETDGTLFSIGVQVYYDEGPVIAAVENADTRPVSAKEVEAAARVINPEAWETDPDEERGAARYKILRRRDQAVTLARAALDAAREAAHHE